MANLSGKTKAAGDQIRDAGTYMTGQTVAYSLPQAENNIYYNVNKPTESPTYCYLIWQIPPNMSRVNSCSIFWKSFSPEYQLIEESIIRYHLTSAGSTYLKCEISIDEGTTWQTIGSYTTVQSNLSIMTYINQMQDPAGKIMMVRLSCTVDGTSSRLIVGGHIQGNVWSR